VLIATAGVLLAACNDSRAEPSATSSETEIPGPLDEGPPQNWDNPIEGTKISAVQEAEQVLPFVPEEPKGLGSPIGIFVTPEEFPKLAREIAFVFDSTKFGRVVVIERPTPIALNTWHEHIAELVAGNGAPTRSGTAASVTVRDGLEALLTTTDDGGQSALFWIESDVQFIVDGPALQAADVQEIADLV
jgi:hypothetical protein